MSRLSQPFASSPLGLRATALVLLSASVCALQACKHPSTDTAQIKRVRASDAPKMCTLWQRGRETPLREIPCQNLDSDLDGIDDAVDLCPMLQEVENGIADGDGCPDPDPDQDGYADFEDACPQLSGVAPDGCPFLDKDRDFIADHLDACPNQPEDIDGEEDGDGCPEGVFRQRNARALQEQVWLAEKLEVRPGSVKLSRQGKNDFKRLQKQLSQNVDVVRKIRVVGYASVLETAQGRAKRLAQRRVRRIRSKLRKMGFPKDVFSYSVYPLKNGGERVGRIEVTVLVPLKLSLEALHSQSISADSAQWIRPATYENNERIDSSEQRASPPGSQPLNASLTARQQKSPPLTPAISGTERAEVVAPKSESKSLAQTPSMSNTGTKRARSPIPAKSVHVAPTSPAPAPDKEPKVRMVHADEESAPRSNRVNAEQPRPESDDMEMESPRRGSQLFDDDELPDEDPRVREALRAPAPLAKTRIDLSNLDDSDEDLLFEDDESSEELDLPEGDAAEADVLFFEEPNAPKSKDWEASSSH